MSAEVEVIDLLDDSNSEYEESKTNKSVNKNNEKILKCNINDEIIVIESEEDNGTVTNDSSKPSYYQRAFIAIISSVIEVYDEILSSEEISILKRILHEVSIPAQRLFIRLIMRKVGWHRINKLVYDDIPLIKEAIDELCIKDLCTVNSQDSLEYLELLTQLELKSIANNLFINLKSSSIASRQEIIKIILESKPSGQQKLSFLKSGTLSISSIKERNKLSLIKEFTGSITKVCDEVRQLIDTAISLYFLVSQAGGGSSQENLSTAILVEINRRSYPKYKIIRNSPIFRTRNEYVEYQSSLELEISIKETADISNEIFEEIKSKFDKSIVSCDLDRSYFLRRFTAGWIYCKILSQMASTFETLKQHKKSMEIYEILLKQELFCLGYRGKWWERSVLNTSKHLKDSKRAIELCEFALKDSWLRTAALTSIKRRQKKLQKSNSSEDNGIEEEDEDEIEIIKLKGKIQSGNLIGKKVKLYLDGDELSLGSVEEFVLNEFSKDGWSGVHSESSCFTTLFALLFWDLLFEIELSDVFQTPYQTAPLDLTTDAFYPLRKKFINERLKVIEEDFETAIKILEKNHLHYHMITCVGVNWNDYTGAEGINILIKVARGIGGMALSLILRQLCEDYRHNRSGMPDLILWRSLDSDSIDKSKISSNLIEHANNLIFAEVKSPNDRLSDGQRHWFQILKSAGLRVVVVRVLDDDEEQEDYDEVILKTKNKKNNKQSLK